MKKLLFGHKDEIVSKIKDLDKANELINLITIDLEKITPLVLIKTIHNVIDYIDDNLSITEYDFVYRNISRFLASNLRKVTNIEDDISFDPDRKTYNTIKEFYNNMKSHPFYSKIKSKIKINNVLGSVELIYSLLVNSYIEEDPHYNDCLKGLWVTLYDSVVMTGNGYHDIVSNHLVFSYKTLKEELLSDTSSWEELRECMHYYNSNFLNKSFRERFPLYKEKEFLLNKIYELYQKEGLTLNEKITVNGRLLSEYLDDIVSNSYIYTKTFKTLYKDTIDILTDDRTLPKGICLTSVIYLISRIPFEIKRMEDLGFYSDAVAFRIFVDTFLISLYDYVLYKECEVFYHFKPSNELCYLQ